MKLAVITTVYRPDSHTDVIMARWFEDLPSDSAWGWHGPKTEIASAYVAQRPANDLSATRFAEQGVPVFSTIAEALRVGGSELAVDGVLLIAEHGEYPYNKLGQRLYPRSEMFHAVCNVFEADGRSVPVFFDKHLSWDFERGREMLERAGRLGFGVLSASSLPFCRYDPPVDCDGQAVEEVLAVFPLVDGGKPESYGYHALEVVQHVLERRRGGAAGVESVMAWRGAEVWDAAESRRWSAELLGQVWTRAMPGRPLPSAAIEAELEEPSHAFVIRYADGLELAMVGVTGTMEFSFGFRVGDQLQGAVIRAGLGEADRYPNFAILSRVAEDWLIGGPAPYPDERVLLTCGTLQAMAQSAALPAGTPLETPHLTGLGYTPAPQRSGVAYLAD
ncbi:MAG: hypothetical protein AAF797_02315 [Planctomycetota bacterium]